MIDISLKKYDSRDMYQNIIAFHKQLIDGLGIGQDVSLGNLSKAKYDKVILAGMGGSAIAGDLLKSVLLNELTIPLNVHRDYNLPGYVNSDTLVICSSYSGNTEETISAFKAAHENKCHIICISTGGELSNMADRFDVPLIKIPAGFMPREALGLSFSPLLTVFGRLGLVKDYSNELKQCAGLLDSWKNEYLFESRENIAMSLAEKLAGKIIIIYSGPGRFDSVALRFKGQVCENSKQLAFCNVFPEFNHNELVGWELSSSFSDRFIVLIIRDKDDHPQIVRRMNAVKDILIEKNITVEEIFSKGDGILTRIFSIIQIADFTSYYMALKNKVDPSPINLIEYLKASIASNEEKR